MRFLITASAATSEPRADEPVGEELIAAYMKYNEDMTKAGVLVTAEGLTPDGARARVATSGGMRVVVDGPFAEAKELVGGFYLIEVPSKEEAIAWALRCPVGLGTDDVLDIHQMTELSDLPPRLREIIAAAAPTWSAPLWRPRRTATC
jgi:hypothetical protein